MWTKESNEKRKRTCMERYGIENPFQSEEFKEKMRQTWFKKYGVKNPAQSKEYQMKHRSTYWNTFCSNLKERNIVPLFGEEEYINDTGRMFKCSICDKEFFSDGKHEDLRYDLVSTLSTQIIFCPHCFKAHYSKAEKEVVDFVKSIYEGEISENHKGLFPNKQMELDIYLPQLNLGIEFDGDYWHSKEGAKEKDERKNQLCEEKGIRLIRIKEKDWTNNREQVEKQIREVIEELIFLNRTTENVA